MSQVGFTPIQIYRSATAATLPVAGNLAAGELAINTTDEKLYFENTGGTVTLLASSAAAGGTFTTVTATTVVNGLGAVGTPSYTFTGDLNTGMWSPAADTIAFSEGGAEAMRIDSSGNLGIGTTTPGTKLEVTGDITQTWATSMDRFIGSKFSTSYEVGLHLLEATRETRVTSKAADGTGLISLYTGVTPTERMRINSAGLVGIGTTGPTTLLDVRGAAVGANVSAISIDNTSAGSGSPANTVSLNFSNAGSVKASITGAVYGDGYMAFATNTNTEKMRLTAAGSLGIGNTAPASVLDVTGQITTRGAVGAFVAVSRDGSGADWSLYNPTGDDFRIFGNSADRLTITNAGDVGIGTNAPNAQLAVIPGVNPATATGTLQVAIGEASNNAIYQMRMGYYLGGTYQGVINVLSGGVGADLLLNPSGGNVGIGTTAPGEILDIRKDTSGTQLRISTSDNGNIFYAGWATGASYIGAAGYNSPALGFQTGGSERMRVAANGDLLVGTTLNQGTGRVSIVPSIGGTTCINTQDTASTYYVGLWYTSTSTLAGYISVSGSTTSYISVSDNRMKENIADADSASSLIDALQVRKFDWKTDGKHQRYGFVAQELVKVAPEAVHVPENEEQMMGVDYSKLVPMLIKEVQALRARVAQLEGK